MWIMAIRTPSVSVKTGQEDQLHHRTESKLTLDSDREGDLSTLKDVLNNSD